MENEKLGRYSEYYTMYMLIYACALNMTWEVLPDHKAHLYT